MPAQSPTLSPTLSAITAGLRGSSSGMPASTLPTRSAPTSAPLVKMPPPSRAKMEMSELRHEADDEKHHPPDDRDRRVLALEIRHRAFAHGRRDLAHALVARGQPQDAPRLPDAVNDGEDRATEREG